MYGSDPDDIWVRLLVRLRERKQELTDDVIAGGLDPYQYQHACGRIAEIDETIELAGKVRRGEDRRPAPAGQPRTVED